MRVAQKLAPGTKNKMYKYKEKDICTFWSRSPASHSKQLACLNTKRTILTIFEVHNCLHSFEVQVKWEYNRVATFLRHITATRYKLGRSYVPILTIDRACIVCYLKYGFSRSNVLMSSKMLLPYCTPI